MDEEKRNRENFKEAREIVKGHNISDSQRFSLDEIMAEYQADAAPAPSARPEEPPALTGEETRALGHVVEEMQAFVRENPPVGEAGAAEPDPEQEKAKQREPRVTPEDSPPPTEAPFTQEEDFGSLEDFQSAFSPSEDFVRGTDSEEEEEELWEEALRPPREGLFVRMRRRAHRPADNTPSLPVDTAAAKLVAYVRFFTLRTAVAASLSVLLLLVTFAHRMELSMPAFLNFWQKPGAYMAIQLLLLVLVMVCAIDVLARGLLDLCHFRPGMESAALLSCLANILYIVCALFNPASPAYLPYCSVAALSTVCCLWANRLRFSACQRAYKTAAQSENPYVIVREENALNGDAAFFKLPGAPADFVARTEQPDGAMNFSRFVISLGFLVALLFSVISAVSQGSVNIFFWAFAAITSVLAPFGGFFPFVLPFSRVTARLAQSGAALAGWAGTKAFYEPACAVLTDGDLFPPGSVALSGLKVFGGYNFERVISYATSLTAASGSGLVHPFVQLLRGQSETIHQVQEFMHHEGGGMGGEIGGDRILLGTSSFMLRMGFQLPQGIALQNALFLSINLDLAGIFAVTYTPLGSVRQSLAMFFRHNILPVFAMRDVNLTPSFIGKRLKVDVDGAEFPTIEQRLALSDPERATRAYPAAIVGREGLAPYAESIVAGRRLGQVTRLNLVLYLLCTLAGLLIMCYLAMQGEVATASPCNVVVYLGLWLLPILLSSGFAARF